ncbi:YdcH family protein [Vibrio sp. JC009]|uniref:YdcH family protein n=1 Tax=Vibrio sp. JC009 TaxID=2912314 RepID=UPI0023AFFA44|nr:YdcH family protein [Vibrio sp. JC009]WED23746.1 YdcH family protein [Vibrio sp. JC009]
MLGENHSLLNEFPEFKELIAKLVESDNVFANDTRKYNSLDEEIRNLELNGSPVIDQSMHQMKHDRSVLKDSLYQRLLQAKA